MRAIAFFPNDHLKNMTIIYSPAPYNDNCTFLKNRLIKFSGGMNEFIFMHKKSVINFLKMHIQKIKEYKKLCNFP